MSAIEEKINSRIKELGYNFKFHYLKSGWKGYENTVLILEDLDFEEIAEVNYSSFMKTGWIGKKRKRANIIEKRKRIAKETIGRKINELKEKGVNLEFLKFADGKSPEEVILDKVRLRLKDLDYNYIGETSYMSFFYRGWTCGPRIGDMQRIPEEEILKRIDEKIAQLKIDRGYNIRFLRFENRWEGVVNSKLVFEDLDYGDVESIEYGNFMSKGWTCYSRLCDNRRGFRIQEDEALERIREKLSEINKTLGDDIIAFSRFNPEWTGQSTILVLVDKTTKEEKEMDYSNFLYRGWFGTNNSFKTERICKSIIASLLDENEILEHHPIIEDFDKSLCSKTKIIPDFWIKSRNCIIEYDGQQHYEYIPFFQESYQCFLEQVQRDKALVQYCKDNSIRLLRIPYKDDNRLEEVIRTFLVDGINIATHLEPILSEIQ